jgi:hypothetical protein
LSMDLIVASSQIHFVDLIAAVYSVPNVALPPGRRAYAFTRTPHLPSP